MENVPEEDITELAKTMDAVDSKIYPRLAEFVSRGLVEDDTAALIARLYTGKRTTYRANRGYCQNDSWDVRVSRRKIYGRLIEELKSFSVTGENSWLIDTVKHRLENSFTLGLGGVKWFDEHWAMKIAEEQKTEESK